MIEHRYVKLTPFARFLVEREPGRGYQVTRAEGPEADAWKEPALALLNAIGQPDPNGPKKCLYLVSSGASLGDFVSVLVEIFDNGEASFHQAWFRVSTQAWWARWQVGAMILFIVIIGVAAIAWRFLPPANDPTDRPPLKNQNGSAMLGSRDSAVKVAPPDAITMQLKDTLPRSRSVRERLKEYLSQEGFAADKPFSVVVEKRSVKLISDLDRSPPPVESIPLSNLEVARLLEFLETVDEWEKTPKPALEHDGR